ncbi:MAG: ascorbate-dependent monooxygenase [Acidobacteriota bacterium]
MLARLILICFLATASLWAEVTYARQVSRILESRCASCHRPGDIGPMSLLTYDDAVAYSPDIERVVKDGIMPPWKPSDSHGTFKGAFALKPEEKADLLSWVAAGTPFGNEADLPERREQASGWLLGEPDLVVRMPQPYTPARGKDVYRCFVLPTGLDADQFVSAIDIEPGNRRIVHHVIVYIDSSGEAEKLDARDEEPGYDCYGGPGFDIGGSNIQSLLLNGYTLGGWAPGARADRLPQGIGMKLGKAARIVLQVHYYTGGRTGEDQTAVGLYFNQERVEKQLYYIPVVNTRLDIPAGNANYTVSAEFPVFPGLEMRVINAFPHMHMIGKRIELERQASGVRTRMMLIDQWDFNWQGAYTYVEPIRMPAFSQVNLRCTYDNSANNPRNPNNPLKNVRWGEGTEDEMCLAFLGVVFERF